jgi:rhomboid protease GluP
MATPPPIFEPAGGQAIPASPQVPVSLKFHGSRSHVTYTFLGICVILYAGQYLSQLLTGYDIPFALGGKINELISAGQFWRLFTPMLLHGSIFHLGLNMYALLILGRNMEYHFGHTRFTALFIAAGFAGNTLSYLFSPTPSLGSSTAIFGLLGAEVIFVYLNRRFYGSRSRPILINAAIVAGINLVLGLSPGIDNWGHLGGLLGGMIFAFVAGPRWQVAGSFPELTIVDSRPRYTVWLGFVFVLAVFSTAIIIHRLITPQ